MVRWVLPLFSYSIILALVGNEAFAAQEVISKECDARVNFSMDRESTIALRKIDGLLVNSFFPSKESLRRLSKVCEIALPDETEYTTSKRVTVFFKHEPTEFRPRIYTWDQTKSTWKSHESTMNRKTWVVSAEIPFQKQYVAVFAEETSEYIGTASWYRHTRYPMGSATNIFPLGTKLKVTNRDTGKEVMVTVTSTWTNKDKKRVIDLVRTAFEKIANPSVGLIPVIIERKQEP